MLDCHSPHATNFKGLLKKSVKDTCLTAMTTSLPKRQNQCISRSDDGDCLECHTPHAGKFKDLLKKSVKDICADCHDDITAKNEIIHQPVDDGECMECHTPHAANIKGSVEKIGQGHLRWTAMTTSSARKNSSISRSVTANAWIATIPTRQRSKAC